MANTLTFPIFFFFYHVAFSFRISFIARVVMIHRLFGREIGSASFLSNSNNLFPMKKKRSKLFNFEKDGSARSTDIEHFVFLFQAPTLDEEEFYNSWAVSSSQTMPVNALQDHGGKIGKVKACCFSCVRLVYLSL